MNVLKSLAALAVLCLAPSCQKWTSGHLPACSGHDVRVLCMPSGPVSRSSITAGDDELRSVLLFVYGGGTLCDVVGSDSGELTLSLGGGLDYSVYALANVSGVTPPASEEDIESLRLQFGSYDSFSETGLPMCGRYEIDSDRMPGEIVIRMTRLVSRQRLRIGGSFEKCGFTVSGVHLRQAAMDVAPFAASSAATVVGDGDCASSADIASLLDGGAVEFFVLENARGVLLPGNEDPWMKVPDSIPGESGLCTFLELDGKWRTAGADADIRYRMYLGADSCSDFSVLRNTTSDICLTLTDKGSASLSWHVEMSGLNEGRRLAFTSTASVIPQGGKRVRLPLDVYPSDLEWEMDCDGAAMEHAGIRLYRDGDGIYAMTSYVGGHTSTAVLHVKSWDGALEDSIALTVEGDFESFDNYELDLPEMPYEWGTIRIIDVDITDYVEFSVAGQSFLVGKLVPAMKYHRLYDPVTKTEFYYPEGEHTVYVRGFGVSGEASGEVTMSFNGRTAKVTVYETKAPSLAVEPPSLSETGSLREDGNGPYDEMAEVRIRSPWGGYADLSRFAKPDILLWCEKVTQDDTNRYSDFYHAAVEGLVLEYDAAKMGAGEIVDIADDYGIAADGCIARVPLWGLEADSDRPFNGTFSIYAGSGELREATASVIPYTVNPAFPAQRYLGSVSNRQLLPGDAGVDWAEVPFRHGGYGAVPSADAVWTVSDACFSPEGRPSAALSVMAGAADGIDGWTPYDRSTAVSMDGVRLGFDDVPADGYVPCGAFLLSGEAVNPHSGRIIRGWYTLDVVLELPVGVHADLSDGGISYSFAPLCRYGSAEYAGMWTMMLPDCLELRSPAYPGDVLLSRRSRLSMPELGSDHACRYESDSWRMPRESDCASICRALHDAGFLDMCMPFKLRLEHVSATSILLDRYGYSNTGCLDDPAHVKGGRGYYHLFRYYDSPVIALQAGCLGFDRVMQEAAYGDFDSW